LPRGPVLLLVACNTRRLAADVADVVQRLRSDQALAPANLMFAMS
jgi:hypothetical protein